MLSKLALSTKTSGASACSASLLRVSHPVHLDASRQMCREEHMTHIRRMAASGDLETVVSQEADIAMPEKVEAASRPTRPVTQEVPRHTLAPEPKAPTPSSNDAEKPLPDHVRNPLVRAGGFGRGHASLPLSDEDIPTEALDLAFS